MFDRLSGGEGKISPSLFRLFIENFRGSFTGYHFFFLPSKDSGSKDWLMDFLEGRISRKFDDV